MKPTRLLIVLSALLVIGLMPPLAADEPVEDYYPTDWVTLGADRPSGTFGDDAEVAAIGHELGADLSNGSARMLDEDTLEFRIELHNLPATGGTPEAIRYTWDFQVADGEGKMQAAQLDGKWMNYTRGTCDPTSGQCSPPDSMPRDPGMQPFLFRANQAEGCLHPDPAGTGACGMNFSAYDELAVLRGVFDTEEATITIAVPVDLFNEIDGVTFGHCSEIHPRAGLFGGMIEAMPSAFISSNAMPADTVDPAYTGNRGVYTLPPAEDATVDCEGNPIGE